MNATELRDACYESQRVGRRKPTIDICLVRKPRPGKWKAGSQIKLKLGPGGAPRGEICYSTPGPLGQHITARFSCQKILAYLDRDFPNG